MGEGEILQRNMSNCKFDIFTTAYPTLHSGGEGDGTRGTPADTMNLASTLMQHLLLLFFYYRLHLLFPSNLFHCLSFRAASNISRKSPTL